MDEIVGIDYDRRTVTVNFVVFVTLSLDID